MQIYKPFAAILLDKTEGKGLPKLGEKVGEKVGEKDLEKDLEKLPLNQKKILEFIRNKSMVTQQELSDLIGITEKNIRRHIQKLKQKGLLQRVGPDKGGHWEIIKK